MTLLVCANRQHLLLTVETALERTTRPADQAFIILIAWRGDEANAPPVKSLSLNRAFSWSGGLGRLGMVINSSNRPTALVIERLSCRNLATAVSDRQHPVNRASSRTIPVKRQRRSEYGNARRAVSQSPGEQG